jgi:hypothetical protein
MIIVGTFLGFIGFSLILSGFEWLCGWRNSFYKKVWGFASIVTGVVICIVALYV